jgi:hypothetical protein
MAFTDFWILLNNCDFSKKVSWKSAVLNFCRHFQRFSQTLFHENLDSDNFTQRGRTFEISQFFKMWSKKIGSKAYSNISAPLIFLTKISTNLSSEPKSLWKNKISRRSPHGQRMGWQLIQHYNLESFFRKIFEFTFFFFFQSNRTCPICRGNASEYFESSEEP